MQYDVIVVLAGGLTEESLLPQSVRLRVEKACQLFNQGFSARLLMSGKHSAYWQNKFPKQTEAEAMREYAAKLGVSKKAIFKEEQSTNTFTNIEQCKKLFFVPNDWRRICFVTSDFHVQRTQIICDELLGTNYRVDYLGIYSSSTNILQRLRQRLNEFLQTRALRKQFKPTLKQ